jgi:hypothetical protein
LPVDQVDAVRPAGIRFVGWVVEPVKDCRELDPQLAHTGAGDLATLLRIPGAGKDNLVLKVALGLPNVAGMGLQDVDDKKRNLLIVLIVEGVEGGNLPPEWRSSIAAKDQDDGLLRSQ